MGVEDNSLEDEMDEMGIECRTLNETRHMFNDLLTKSNENVCTQRQ